MFLMSCQSNFNTREMKAPIVTRYNNDWKSREAYEKKKVEERAKEPVKAKQK